MKLAEPPPEPPAPSLRLRIDRQALADNWRTLDRLSGNAATGAAVKADGYGLGIDHVMPALLDAGARQFFVAHWSEVGPLLAHVPGASVAVLHGVANAQEAAYARQTGAVPVINSLHQAAVWLESGGGTCHLMVDTGINRLGVEPDKLGDPLVGQLQIDTLLSHLASADEDSALNARQLAAFRALQGQVTASRFSLSNSAGIALGSDYHFDLTRPGLALYGGVPRAELADSIRPVVRIEAAVMQVRQLRAGDSVGYNATWTAEQPTRVATVSLGYADGLLRGWGSGCALHHDGTVLPILGRVSMDMIVLDCSQSNVRDGDFCHLVMDLPRNAEMTGMSQYELLTVLGDRFERSF